MANGSGRPAAPGPDGMNDVTGGPAALCPQSAEGADAQARPSRWSMLVADMSPLDWLVIVYFFLLFVGVVFGAGPDRGLACRIILELVLILVAGLGLTRGGVLPRGSFASALVYRLTIFFTVFPSYFELRVILPACTQRVVDGSLYAIDLSVFHVEPAVAWDRFVTPHTTEWFAFFYFGFFFLLAFHVLPMMFLARNMRMFARFAFAVVFVFCAGHLLYIVVPGYGPYRFLAATFQHPLEGGVFWDAVKATVADAGAQKDIFPSVHTAIPTTFTLLAFKYRREYAPYRISWPVVGFFASQIIIATMFLRWHYLIDICAGLALAALAVALAERTVRWDEARRERLGLLSSWAPLVLRRS